MSSPAGPPGASTGPLDASDEDNETTQEHKSFQRPRRGGVVAEPYIQGYYKEPFWNKHEKWDIKLREVMKNKGVMANITDADVNKIIRSMSTHIYYAGDCIAHQGEDGDYLFVVLEGQVDSYYDAVVGGPKGSHRPHQNERELKEQELKDRSHSGKHCIGAIVDEIMCVWRLPRLVSHYARGDQVIIAKLTRQDYVNLIVRSKNLTWWARQDRLVKVPLLEMMEPEAIAKLVDVMTIRKFEANENCVVQGDVGDEFFILSSGAARVWGKIGDDEQEFVRLYGGDLFGELALLNNANRAATVTTITRTECLVLGRKQFERVLGPMSMLQNSQYLTDPRKLIGEFYKPGDPRGSLGTLLLNGKEVDPTQTKSRWFAVYRPTSRDAIAKMLSGSAVGKGLNVKGKSSKQGVLSGYVPFSQVSDNKHKPMIEKSPKGARTKLYFRSKAAREEALKKLTTVMNGLDARSVEVRKIDCLEDFAPKVYGLELPEPVLHEAYLMNADLSPVMGWETGRRSEPAFMDMNLHAIRDMSEPKVVLYQFDESDPMNVRGLLIAYAEDLIKPVVSDFDTFTVASIGMSYEPVPEDQQKIVAWMLEHAEVVLKSPDHNPWTVRWLEVLKKEGERGFHPKFPKYGYGDPTSYRLIGDIVNETKECGAIRHGAECFNYYFPQELDDEYLVVWDGFPDKPWAYKTEKTMREFLLERMDDGFSFPMNPLWGIRDKGWWEVWEKSLKTTAPNNVAAWYSKKLGIIDTLNRVHAECPAGFIQSADVAEAAKKTAAGKSAAHEKDKGYGSSGQNAWKPSHSVDATTASSQSKNKSGAPAAKAAAGGGGFFSKMFSKKK